MKIYVLVSLLGSNVKKISLSQGFHTFIPLWINFTSVLVKFVQSATAHLVCFYARKRKIQMQTSACVFP